MKLIFTFFSFISLVLLSAAPVENTATPQLITEGFVISRNSWINFRLGYEGDFVGDGRLEQTIQGSGRVDTFQQYTNSAVVTLNMLERFDLFGVFGSSRVCSNWRFNLAGVISQIQLETFYDYFWGIGARGILLEWGKVYLGIDGRYSYCSYKPVWLTMNSIPVNVSETHLKWKEWQLALNLSYRIDLFTPYFGFKYSNACAEIGTFPVPISSSGQGSDHFTNRTPVGFFIGCSISNGKYFMLNIEGRLIDEDAVTISGDLRF